MHFHPNILKHISVRVLVGKRWIFFHRHTYEPFKFLSIPLLSGYSTVPTQIVGSGYTPWIQGLLRLEDLRSQCEAELITGRRMKLFAFRHAFSILSLFDNLLFRKTPTCLTFCVCWMTSWPRCNCRSWCLCESLLNTITKLFDAFNTYLYLHVYLYV